MAPRKAEQGPTLAPVRHDLLEIEALGLPDRPLRLREAHQDRAGLLKELRGEVTDVAESLNHDPLAGDAGREPERLHVLRYTAELPDAEEHSPARGLDPAADPARAHRLGGDAAERVELARAELRVGVRDPGHLARAGADVRRRHVESGTHEVLPHQLEHVPAGDSLQLAHGVPLGIEPDPALGAAERHVHQGALVRHERGQRLHLFGVHGLRVPDAALARQLVVAVLRPPGVHHLDLAVVAFDGKAGVEEVLAGLDVDEERGIVPRESGRAVERVVHLLEKAGAQ